MSEELTPSMPQGECPAPAAPEEAVPKIEICDLTMAYGDFVVMKDLNAEVSRGEVFIIMGGSGCGKSTLLKHMIGLVEPKAGDIVYDGVSFTHASTPERIELLRHFGILYQSGALFSSMTLAENVALPLRLYTTLKKKEIYDLARFKLSLVGLSGFEDYLPDQISGGMRKRAGLARAMALDPDILFFDEPSAGLDPLSSRRLDDLILELRQSLGTTVVVVTHELASIFAIADRCLFLDAQTRRQGPIGHPQDLLQSDHEGVRTFLRRGEESAHDKPH
jgi:phospholipid/cholesterol/gamma-HCH transport system ATP-binding protein